MALLILTGTSSGPKKATWPKYTLKKHLSNKFGVGNYMVAQSKFSHSVL